MFYKEGPLRILLICYESKLETKSMYEKKNNKHTYTNVIITFSTKANVVSSLTTIPYKKKLFKSFKANATYSSVSVTLHKLRV